MANSLKGKVALITGSGQGVGRGIALYFAKEGAKVITNNRKPMKVGDAPSELSEEEKKQWLSLRGDAQTVADEIRAMGGEAEPYFCDVSDFNAAGKMIDFAIEKFGKLDILVNNAAICTAGALLNLSEKDWDKETIVKMKGTFNCMRHAVPYMVKQGGGRILNCASDAWVGVGNMAAYSAANAGVVGVSKACAVELARFGITCNVYCPQAASPGHITGFSEVLRTLSGALGKAEMDPVRKAEVDKDHGDAVDMAPFLAYLCSDAGKDISGAVFSVRASGKIELYSDPVVVRKIQKDDAPWTVEELTQIVPETLLKGVKNYADSNQY